METMPKGNDKETLSDEKDSEVEVTHDKNVQMNQRKKKPDELPIEFPVNEQRKRVNDKNTLSDEKDSKVEVTHDKNLQKNHRKKKPEELPVEIPINEQWERVNCLVLIGTFILAFNAAFWMIYLIVILPPISEPKENPIIKDVELVTGFPTLHLALITNEGYIDDFSIDRPRMTNMPKLQKTSLHGDMTISTFGGNIFRIFGVYSQSFLYFLYSDPKRNVVKLNLKSNKFETLPSSRIKNGHVANQMNGFRVGPYFWVLGGFNTCTGWTSNCPNTELQTKSSLWCVKKDRWIEGPEKPFEIFGSRRWSAIGINSTSAAFVVLDDSKSLFMFHFPSNTWHKMSGLPQDQVIEFTSLAIVHEKDYKRKLLIMGTLLGYAGRLLTYDLDTFEFSQREVTLPSPIWDSFGSISNLRGNLFYFVPMDLSYQLDSARNYTSIYHLELDTGSMQGLLKINLFSEALLQWNKFDDDPLNLTPLQIVPYYRRNYKSVTLTLK